MNSDRKITFGRFRLDETNECLWHDSQAISLRPKAYAVLKYLVAHAGKLVTKQQLLDAVWHDTFVSDAVLKDSIRQLREALGDEAKSSRFIETAHRRGYRFIAPIDAEATRGRGEQPAPYDTGESRQPVSQPSQPPGASARSGVHGRESELAQMRSWLQKALLADPQIVFVTGEPGIGKTTLVEAFLYQANTLHSMWIARGQCLEQYGAGEAYLPVLDGLSRLGREPGGERVIELLRQHAPTWLVQMPWLIAAADRESLQEQVLGATRERMLREMAQAVDALTAENPLVLVLEDLHWSDYSTLDLISYLARRHQSARLMLVATYRPVEVILSEHPLKGVKQELQMHKLCRELPLEYLTEADVAEFLEARFPAHLFTIRLAQLIHRRTEGNPLFIVNVVDYLLDEKIILEHEGSWQLQVELAEVELDVPENIRHLIEKQIDRLTQEEQRVLEGASVVGMDCSAVAMSAGLSEDVVKIEEVCDSLARRNQFLLPAYLAELPDGTLTPRYRFIHALYLDVLYRRVAATRRSRIHGRIGECGETIYGDRVGEIAAELAVHFEQGRDGNRAVKYLQLAAENAARRFAHHEAVELARRGLALIKTLPERAERAQQELSLRLVLGASLMTQKGYADAEVEQVFAPARDLCEQQVASPQQFKVLWSLGLFYTFRAEMKISLEIAEQFLPTAVSLQDSNLIMEAHRALGVTLVYLGRFTQALEHLDQASALYDAGRQDSHFMLTGNDAKVMSRCFAGWTMWCLGYMDQSLDRIHEALEMAQGLPHVQSLVAALNLACHLHQLRREWSIVKARAETAITLAEEYGLKLWAAFGNFYRGWALCEQGDVEVGIERMRAGLGAYQATGARLWRTHFLGLLAETLGKAKRVEEALTLITDALATAQQTGESYNHAELYRIKGELLMLAAIAAIGGSETRHRDAENSRAAKSASAQTESSLIAQSEACFNQALIIARKQQAKSWELRAATSLGRLYRHQGRQEEARQVVTEVYDWFKEGFDTTDLKQARALIGTLSKSAPGA